MLGVSYHQSVFDLIDVQPRVSPEAIQMIETQEQRAGLRLPESVRQWYSFKEVVPLQLPEDLSQAYRQAMGYLWYDYSNMDHPESLAWVLRQFVVVTGGRQPHRLRVLVENQGVCSWYVDLDGSDDPPVIIDEHYDHEKSRVIEWFRVANHFSEFIFDWVAGFYFEDWTPLSERDYHLEYRIRPPRQKPYLNELWLYSPRDISLAAPYLDFLIENLVEDSRREIETGVFQYQFRDGSSRLRVTTDDPEKAAGVSAWWLHADNEEDLFHLARRVRWCSNLEQTLKCWTKKASAVMDRLHEDKGTTTTR